MVGYSFYLFYGQVFLVYFYLCKNIIGSWLSFFFSCNVAKYFFCSHFYMKWHMHFFLSEPSILTLFPTISPLSWKGVLVSCVEGSCGPEGSSPSPNSHRSQPHRLWEWLLLPCVASDPPTVLSCEFLLANYNFSYRQVCRHPISFLCAESDPLKTRDLVPTLHLKSGVSTGVVYIVHDFAI